MGKLILNVNDEGVITEANFDGDTKLSLDGAIAFSMAFMETVIRDFGSKKENIPYLTDLYDSLDAIFYTFMERTFPGIQPRDFELSDAAVLYAQDMIIELAEKEGIPFEKALKKYENEAKAYVQQKGKIS